MTAGWSARLAALDPSLALATASLLQCSDKGQPTFGALVRMYREDYVMRATAASGDLASRPALAEEDVRRHLAESVLPRLVTEEVCPSLPSPLENDSIIQLDESLLAYLADFAGARESLLAAAREGFDQVDLPATGRTAAPSGSVLTGKGLTKIYKRRAVVDDVDLRLQQGEIVGLLGPNGAGKTTSFYMIVGLIRPDGGQIFIDGKSISQMPMYRRSRLGVGYLAQEPSVFRKLTVEKNVMAILETLPLRADERRERLESLLDELSIKHLRDVAAYKLSGGERRRLEITRALVTEPKFMLLDEPFAGVDPIAVHDIQVIVAGLRSRGIGVLITDHNVEQTLDIVDRAYIMFEGKVQVSGTVRELVYDDRVADLYLGPTLTARLRARLESAA